MFNLAFLSKHCLIIFITFLWYIIHKLLHKFIISCKSIKLANIEKLKLSNKIISFFKDTIFVFIYIYLYNYKELNSLSIKEINIIEIYFIITCSYYIYDFWLLIKFKDSIEFKIHHLAIIFPLLFSIFSDKYFYILVKIWVYGSISNPIIYLANILEYLKEKKEIIKHLGAIFIIFFIIFRFKFFEVWYEAYNTSPFYIYIFFYIECNLISNYKLYMVFSNF